MHKPMTKHILTPIINEDKTGIRFGGYQPNITRDIEVDDPEEFYRFLKLLDGTRTSSDLAKAMGLSISDVKEVLETLKAAAVIQENDPEKFGFKSEEQEYYKRNISFFSKIDIKGLYYNYWEVQSILKNSHILLLGAGGTGGSCAQSLARLGIGKFSIVDCDKVEQTNLNRQEFTIDDIGAMKTESLKRNLGRINPFITFNTYDTWIESSNSLFEIDDSYDLIICCIDSPKGVHSFVETYAEKKNIPWILGGYANTVFNNGIFLPGDVKYSELIGKSIEQFYDLREIEKNTDWEVENSIIAPVAQASGDFSALYAFYWLTQLNDLKGSRIEHIDLFNLQNKDFNYSIHKDSLKVSSKSL